MPSSRSVADDWVKQFRKSVCDEVAKSAVFTIGELNKTLSDSKKRFSKSVTITHVDKNGSKKKKSFTWYDVDILSKSRAETATSTKYEYPVKISPTTTGIAITAAFLKIIQTVEGLADRGKSLESFDWLASEAGPKTSRSLCEFVNAVCANTSCSEIYKKITSDKLGKKNVQNIKKLISEVVTNKTNIGEGSEVLQRITEVFSQLFTLCGHLFGQYVWFLSSNDTITPFNTKPEQLSALIFPFAVGGASDEAISSFFGEIEKALKKYKEANRSRSKAKKDSSKPSKSRSKAKSKGSSSSDEESDEKSSTGTRKTPKSSRRTSKSDRSDRSDSDSDVASKATSRASKSSRKSKSDVSSGTSDGESKSSRRSKKTSDSDTTARKPVDSSSDSDATPKKGGKEKKDKKPKKPADSSDSE